MGFRYVVAIPVYNEEDHVDEVLQQVLGVVDHVLVIDDGSTDRTPEKLAQYPDVSVIRHLENRGYGMSLADAYRFAHRSEFDWLITMDCDGQHESRYLPLFLEAARSGKADIISGTRYPLGRGVPEGVAPVDRRKINGLVTSIINDRLGLEITDAFCGYKAYRVSVLDCFDITVPGYAMPLQFWVQAARAGLRIEELPISLIYADPTRHFGGLLDDPQVRLAHYLEVFETELKSTADAARHPCQNCAPGR